MESLAIMVRLVAWKVFVWAVTMSWLGTMLLPTETVLSSHCVNASSVTVANSVYISLFILLSITNKG